METWYFFLEIIGSFISIFTLVEFIRISKLLGGAIGKLLTTISVSLGLVTAALLLRSYTEFTGSEAFSLDVTFEALLYVALLLMLISAKQAGKQIKKVRSGSFN